MVSVQATRRRFARPSQSARVGARPARTGKQFVYLPCRPEWRSGRILADILRVENEETYQWRDWSDVPEWNNIWGPLPPENFREYGVGLA